MAVWSQDRKTDAVVSVRGLGKTFGDMVAFADVSFEIERGEIFGFPVAPVIFLFSVPASDASTL